MRRPRVAPGVDFRLWGYGLARGSPACWRSVGLSVVSESKRVGAHGAGAHGVSGIAHIVQPPPIAWKSWMRAESASARS